MKSFKFNINDHVSVKLTPHGRKLHRSNYDQLMAGFKKPPHEYVPVKEDAAGWSEWQLWCLMSEFGKHMHNGCELPFATDIQIASPTQSRDN